MGHDRSKLAGDNLARRGAELQRRLTHVSVDGIIAEIETFEQVASRTAVRIGRAASDPNPLVAPQLYSGYLRQDGFQLHPVLDLDVENG